MTGRAEETVHAVAHEHGHELVCSCGTLLSNYGLTRTLHSIWAEHLRSVRETRIEESSRLAAVRLLVAEWEGIRGDDKRAVEQWHDAAAELARALGTNTPPIPSGGGSDA